MTSSGYLSLRKNYIDQTRRKIANLEKEFLYLTELGSGEILVHDGSVEDLVRGMRVSKIQLEEMLMDLERISEDLWSWTQMVDEIESLWARISRTLSQVQLMVEENMESGDIFLEFSNNGYNRLNGKEWYYATQY